MQHQNRPKLEKAVARYSSTLAWKIPWMEEPGRLRSMESLRVGHDWATSLSLFTFTHWRRKWQPTPVFLPVESQGWGNLVGCRLWDHTESEWLKWLSSSRGECCLTGKRSVCFFPTQHLVLSTQWVSIVATMGQASLDYSFAGSGSHFTSQV